MFLFAYAAAMAVFLAMLGRVPGSTEFLLSAFSALPVGLLGILFVHLFWPAWEFIARLRAAGGWQGLRTRDGPVNWARVFAAVLTSKLFFVASCTGGMFAGSSAFDGLESGLHRGVNRPIDSNMAVIALVPKPGNPGGTQLVQTSLGKLEQFRKENPDHSFLIPAGEGAIADASPLIRTEYTATAVGPTSVVVQTRFTLDENHVDARYEATAREIRPHYTKTSHDMATFMAGMAVGFPLAIALSLLGRALRWWTRRKPG